MAAKEISVKRYVVRLSADEREQLEALIRKGKSPAQRLLKARILLKADVSESGEGWSDSRIIKALETSASMVYRVRKQLVEEGFEAVLSRKQRAVPAGARVFCGQKEKKKKPLACFQPPQRRARPALRLLGEKGGGKAKFGHAHVLKELADRYFANAKTVVLVQDNLNIHGKGSLYEAFPAAEARRLVERFEWHYTPKHGSWLDLAESELGVLTSQCLDRRIADKQTLVEQIAAWEHDRNANHTKANWQFSTPNARIKLKHLYPAI